MEADEQYPGFPTGWANEEELRAQIASQRGVGTQSADRIFQAWSLAIRLLDMGEAPDELMWKRWFMDDEMRGAMKVLLNPLIKSKVRSKIDFDSTMLAGHDQTAKPAVPTAETFDADKTMVFGNKPPAAQPTSKSTVKPFDPDATHFA